MTYLLNVLLLSALYFAIYKLVFARFSFFKINRMLLLLLPILSIGTPLLSMLFPSNYIGALNPITIDIIANTFSESTIKTATFSWLNFVFYGYLLIALVAIFKSILRLRAIKLMIDNASRATAFDISHFVSTDTKVPFSFLQAIILPLKDYSATEKEIILKHEAVHCKEKHSIDNLYFTLICSLGWINPFFYLMAKELRQVHECLADDQAIKNTSRAEYAQMLLSQTLGTEIIFPAHAFFNSSLIKTRITMMYKTKTSSKMKWSYLILLPAIALTTIFSCSKQQEAATVDFSRVDSPPLFKSCDKSAKVDDQKICFQKEIINTVATNFKYPESALDLNMEGKVYYGFIINASGAITNIEVKKGLVGNTDAEKQAAEDVNKEATRVLKLLQDLEPAKVNGDAVSMSFTLPINLKLPNKEVAELSEVLKKLDMVLNTLSL